jgi:hypothetical protein
MSTFENHNFRWRETYFVLFAAKKRPTATQIERTLGELNEHFELVGLVADDEGRFESVTLRSPDDFAALDICYVSGDEVAEQVNQLAEELAPTAAPAEMAKIKKLKQFDARLDVLHFQDVAAGAAGAATAEEDEGDEMFDPSALLLVLDALVELTGGMAVDPQSGTLL